jgi:hypothetical protein
VAECKAPANVVLLRGCGVRLKVPSFQEKHGMSACIVAPTKVLGGLRSSSLERILTLCRALLFLGGSSSACMACPCEGLWRVVNPEDA